MVFDVYWFWALCCLALFIAGLFVYAALVAAARTDRYLEEEHYAHRDDDHSGF